MSTELYPQPQRHVLSPGQTSLYPVTTRGEIDLRQELQSTLYGSANEIAKGRPVIFRRMRRIDGNLVECACISTLTEEADRDTKCPYCWGERFLWDEEWVTTYKMEVSSQEGFARRPQSREQGITDTPLVFFYMEHSVEPTTNDKILEIRLDTEGDIVTPITREAIFQIATAEDFRSDNGRVEYWRCAVNEESISSTWE